MTDAYLLVTPELAERARTLLPDLKSEQARLGPLGLESSALNFQVALLEAALASSPEAAPGSPPVPPAAPHLLDPEPGARLLGALERLQDLLAQISTERYAPTFDATREVADSLIVGIGLRVVKYVGEDRSRELFALVNMHKVARRAREAARAVTDDGSHGWTIAYPDTCPHCGKIRTFSGPHTCDGGPR